MYNIIHTKGSSIQGTHKNEHEKYEYIKRTIVPWEQSEQCAVSLYELLPGKSAYPYHYHTKNEEVFYIISGEGIIRTPDGEKPISAGDFIFFPANEKGAHKLTNTSKNTNLIYIDFHTSNDLDVAFYPDSGKIGIWGKTSIKFIKQKKKLTIMMASNTTIFTYRITVRRASMH